MSASRYSDSQELSRVDTSGRRVRYLAPRILPQGATVAGNASTVVADTEAFRLDLVAYRTLRDAEQAWRIADANDAMDPFELCNPPGAVVDLPSSPL